MRLIDADKADVERIPTSYGSYSSGEDIKEWLGEQPTVEAMPVVHGRWDKNHPDDTVYYCTNCLIPQDWPTNYCPSCGAKMDGGAT